MTTEDAVRERLSQARADVILLEDLRAESVRQGSLNAVRMFDRALRAALIRRDVAEGELVFVETGQRLPVQADQREAIRLRGRE